MKSPKQNGPSLFFTFVDPIFTFSLKKFVFLLAWQNSLLESPRWFSFLFSTFVNRKLVQHVSVLLDFQLALWKLRVLEGLIQLQ